MIIRNNIKKCEQGNSDGLSHNTFLDPNSLDPNFTRSTLLSQNPKYLPILNLDLVDLRMKTESPEPGRN